MTGFPLSNDILRSIRRPKWVTPMKEILFVIMIAVAFAGCTTDSEAEKSGFHDITAYEARSAPAQGDSAATQGQIGNDGQDGARPNTFSF